MRYNNDGARFPLKTKDSSVCFNITTIRINMDDSDHRNRHEKAAKMLLLADRGKLKESEAMRLAGLSREDSLNRTAQQQVRSMAEKPKNEKKKCHDKFPFLEWLVLEIEREDNFG
mgnify:CR=1 FL=1